MQTRAEVRSEMLYQFLVDPGGQYQSSAQANSISLT